jgi:hypothetical protein
MYHGLRVTEDCQNNLLLEYLTELIITGAITVIYTVVITNITLLKFIQKQQKNNNKKNNNNNKSHTIIGHEGPVVE